jgi:hypothetical protein
MKDWVSLEPYLSGVRAFDVFIVGSDADMWCSKGKEETRPVSSSGCQEKDPALLLPFLQ